MVPKAVADHERGAVAAPLHAGLQTALGAADVRVFGVSSATHLARVLVESDCRMMRSGIDLFVLAAFMRRAGWPTAIAWDAAALRDERIVPTETLPPPRQMPGAVNVVWKGRVLLAPAGGVSIVPAELVAPDRVAVAPAGIRDDQHAANEARPDGDRWWWD